MYNQNKPWFEIFKDARGQFRFRLKAPNGEIIATSEGYTTKQGCQYAVNCVKQYAPIAEVRDLTGGFGYGY